MRCKIFLLLLILLPLANAGSLNEIAKMEVTGGEFNFVDSAQDSSGNSYIIGSFSNGAVFGENELETLEAEQGGFRTTCWGGSMHQSVESFIAKMSPSGEWIWAENIKAHPATIRQYIKYCDTNSIVWSKSVLVDKTGVYIVGSSDAKKLEFGEFSLVASGRPNPYLRINFIAKMNFDGKWIWAKSLAPNITEIQKAILSDDSIVILGEGYSKQILPNRRSNITSGQAIAKLDTEGNFIWNTIIPSNYFSKQNFFPKRSNFLLNSLAGDSSGNFYIAGTYGGTKSFKDTDGKFKLKFVGSYILAKVDSNGKLLWKKISGETYFLKSPPSHLFASDKSIIFTGPFDNQISFDGAKIQNPFSKGLQSKSNDYSEFFAEFHSSGKLKNLSSFYARGYDLVDGKIIGTAPTNTSHIFGKQKLESTLTNDVFVADYSNWKVEQFKFTDSLTHWRKYGKYILGTRVIFEGKNARIFGVVASIENIPSSSQEISRDEKISLVSSSWKEVISQEKISEYDMDKFIDYFERNIGKNSATQNYKDIVKIKEFYIQEKIMKSI